MVAWGDVPTWLLVGVGVVGGGAALWQLGLQRRQLHDQQEVTRAQTRLQERQQADQVDVVARAIDGEQGQVHPHTRGEPVHMVVVTNGSNRPIGEVACKIQVIGTDPSVQREGLADVYGELVPVALKLSGRDENFKPQGHASNMPVLRAGRKAGFVWGFTIADYPSIVPRVRFTDDAGLSWEITADLHLHNLDRRDW